MAKRRKRVPESWTKVKCMVPRDCCYCGFPIPVGDNAYHVPGEGLRHHPRCRDAVIERRTEIAADGSVTEITVLRPVPAWRQTSHGPPRRKKRGH